MVTRPDVVYICVSNWRINQALKYEHLIGIDEPSCTVKEEIDVIIDMFEW